MEISKEKKCYLNRKAEDQEDIQIVRSMKYSRTFHHKHKNVAKKHRNFLYMYV